MSVAVYLTLIYYLSDQSRPFDVTIPIPQVDIALHMMEYGVLSFLVGRACGLSSHPILKEDRVYFAVVFVALYALSDELHQAVIPGRSSEWKDWMSDVVGAAAAQWAVARRIGGPTP